MNEFFVYMLKVSIINTVLYLLYVLFLKNKPDFNWNRLFLLSIIFFSLIIPLLSFNIPPGTFSNTEDFTVDLNFDIFFAGTVGTEDLSNEVIDVFKILSIAYWTMFLIFLSRLMYFIFLLFKSIKNSTVIKHNDYILVSTGEQNTPFSFFHFLFTNDKSYKPNNLDQIIEHEKVHIKQYHSLDIILIEIYALFFWFNPFVFFLKNSIRANHEYLADNGAIKSGQDSIQYQKLLLNEALVDQSIGFVNNFKSVTIKKRIQMIHKNNSPRRTLKIIRLFTIIPVIGILAVIFGFSNNGSVILNKNVFSISAKSAENPPEISPIKDIKQDMISAKYGKKFKNPFTNKQVIHKGIDIRSKTGTSVFATAVGIVKKVEDRKGYGKFIVIQHDEQYSTLYAHLSDFNVKIGQKVKLGDLIGFVGNTGYSTGPHLHYEVIKNGEQVDPINYFEF